MLVTKRLRLWYCFHWNIKTFDQEVRIIMRIREMRPLPHSGRIHIPDQSVCYRGIQLHMFVHRGDSSLELLVCYLRQLCISRFVVDRECVVNVETAWCLKFVLPNSHASSLSGLGSLLNLTHWKPFIVCPIAIDGLHTKFTETGDFSSKLQDFDAKMFEVHLGCSEVWTYFFILLPGSEQRMGIWQLLNITILLCQSIWNAINMRDISIMIEIRCLLATWVVLWHLSVSVVFYYTPHMVRNLAFGGFPSITREINAIQV